MRHSANVVIRTAIIMTTVSIALPASSSVAQRYPEPYEPPPAPQISASVDIPAGLPLPGSPPSGKPKGTERSGADNSQVPRESGLYRGCDAWSVVSRYNGASYPDRSGLIGQAIAESPVDSMTLYSRMCHGTLEFFFGPDGTNAEPPPPTVDDLMPGAFDRAVALIPLPEPALSPPVEVGSLVNFGMWLAVAESDPVTARAEVGAVWAQATATLTSTSFDMGNGDVVECDGAGDLLTPGSPLWDTDEQSPLCGYTYEWPSAPQFTGTSDLAYHLTVTTHWEVWGTGSDGRDEPLGPIDVPFEFTYQVREVQTVGTP
jgi:hypothetical protein